MGHVKTFLHQAGFKVCLFNPLSDSVDKYKFSLLAQCLNIPLEFKRVLSYLLRMLEEGYEYPVLPVFSCSFVEVLHPEYGFAGARAAYQKYRVSLWKPPICKKGIKPLYACLNNRHLYRLFLLKYGVIVVVND